MSIITLLDKRINTDKIDTQNIAGKIIKEALLFNVKHFNNTDELLIIIKFISKLACHNKRKIKDIKPELQIQTLKEYNRYIEALNVILNNYGIGIVVSIDATISTIYMVRMSSFCDNIILIDNNSYREIGFNPWDIRTSIINTYNSLEDIILNKSKTNNKHCDYGKYIKIENILQQ